MFYALALNCPTTTATTTTTKTKTKLKVIRSSQHLPYLHQLSVDTICYVKGVAACVQAMLISQFHNHAQNIRARSQSEAKLLSGGPHASVNMADGECW